MQINQLILQASEPGELLGFYSELMELRATLKNRSELLIDTGSTKLVFKQARAAEPFYHFAINIPANKIGEAREWLLRKKIELAWMEQYKSDIADFLYWHAQSVYFFDPAGNIVELIARFDLDNKTSEPFSSLQFLCISEVGLVFKENELEKEAESLLKNYALSYFEKQPPLAHFKAIGDDEGLFVVVPEKRNWFPTSKAAGVFPMRIDFTNNRKQYCLEM